MMDEPAKPEVHAPSSVALQHAGELVALRFSRLMNATTSPWGVVTDPPVIALATAPLFLAMLAAMRIDASPLVQNVLKVLAALPVVLAIVVGMALRRARPRVVRWLAGLPFPVENMNLILNGLGEELEILFRDARPATPELNMALERVSPSSFVTMAPDGGPEIRPRGPSAIEVRIGVIELKSSPATSNHQRYVRVRSLIEQVLVPLAAHYPIETVRMK
jgi:hypothetical protein